MALVQATRQIECASACVVNTLGGALKGSRRVSGIGDNWAPERLGLHMQNPMTDYSKRLTHRPGKANSQKHTFDTDFFRSKQCREMLKVAYVGAVTIASVDGQLVPMARRAIKKGEIVERGILRGIDEGGLDDTAPNPFVLRLWQDFMLQSGNPWSKYSSRPGPAFLAFGTLMFYRTEVQRYNIKIATKESHVQGFEFDAIATEDIPAGSPLVRRIAKASDLDMPQYAEAVCMLESDAQAFISYQKEVDVRLAGKAGVAVPTLHEDVIYEHVRLTGSGEFPILWCNKTVVLPHPVWDGYGVFASEPIREGDIVESGIHVQINGLNGDRCPYVFTWNKNGERYEDVAKNTWCHGCVNSMFYNSDSPANTRMYRFHDHFRYLIVATADIAEGEEVMHLYASSSWRKCFVQDTNLPKLLPIQETSSDVELECQSFCHDDL